MKLQLTIDHGKDYEILSYLERVADAVDIIEIGYPVIVTYGLGLVKKVHSKFPTVPLCVDAKVFHGGTGVTTRCFEAGASIVTVMASAPDPVIKKMVTKAPRYDGKIMCDLSGVRNVAQRTAEVDDLGVDYVYVASGYKPEYDYDLGRKPFLSFLGRVRPLDLAATAKRNTHRAQLAVGTGITVDTIRDVVALDPALILVGHAILEAADPAAAADKLKRFMPFEG